MILLDVIIMKIKLIADLILRTHRITGFKHKNPSEKRLFSNKKLNEMKERFLIKNKQTR